MQDQLLKKTSDEASCSGIVTITNFLLDGNERAEEIANILSQAHDMDSILYDELVAEMHSLCKTKSVVKHNIVTLAGRSVIARRLVGDVTYSGTINYGALGTGSTAVNANDTVLDTEVARKLFARRTRTNAQVNLDFFYSKNDTDGTYEEFGTLIDGTATVDTGQLYNRVLTGGWTKTDQEAMTVSIQLNVNQS